MSVWIKKEEFSALGDFIRTSFVRDQAVIMTRYPKMNANFLKDFTNLLTEVKALESGLVMTEEQERTTRSLYEEADLLNKELNFLNDYIADAGFATDAVTLLKKDLNRGNIEGAVLKIEAMKQFVTEHQEQLTEEGMTVDFAATLQAHKESLESKNLSQNNFMNNRKKLTSANKAKYEALYDYIAKIMNNGKKVFDGTVTKDEYTVGKTIQRMRAEKRGE